MFGVAARQSWKGGGGLSPEPGKEIKGAIKRQVAKD